MIGFEYCNKLFEIERNIKELSPEKKHEKRQELSKPVLDEFLTWLQSLNRAKQGRLGIAVSYMLNNWECLNNIRYSPCTGTKNLGLTKFNINFNSSLLAWPET